MAGEGEKVEMEAVPLKSDTDAAPAADAAAPTEEKKEKPVAPKKTWFFNAAKKKAAAAEGGADDVEKEKKPKKRCFWQCPKKCGVSEGGEGAEGACADGQMSIGIDMVERDAKAVNDHVKLHFDDIFAEPETFHSWDCTWRAVNRVYGCTATFVYRVLALILVIPAAFIWGVLFAFISALNVYVVMPAGRFLSVPLNWLALAWGWLVAALCNPVTSSFGNCFSRIHVRKYGLNTEPTDLVTA